MYMFYEYFPSIIVMGHAKIKKFVSLKNKKIHL